MNSITPNPSPGQDSNSLDWNAALDDARINAGIDRLSLHQKLMLIKLLADGSHQLRYQTYNALEKLGFVHDRLEPDFWSMRRWWDVLTADGMIAAFRLLDPEYKDGSFFYQLRRQRIVTENARRELRGVS